MALLALRMKNEFTNRTVSAATAAIFGVTPSPVFGALPTTEGP
jgi:hypothetical protein